MEITKKTERFIFESAAWKFLLAIVAITLFKSGVWYIPNLEASRAIAQNPFTNPFINDPNAHYLLWSWLGPFIAWAVGAKSKLSFFAFHFAFSVAFSLLFVKIAFDNFSNETARSSIVLFSILPVSATAYFWISTDSITLFLMLVTLAYPRYALTTLATGTLLGMQHFEQSFFAAAGLLFAVYLSKKHGDKTNYTIKFCILFVLGVIAGKLILAGLFKYYSIEVNSGRLHWLREHLSLLLNNFFFHFHYIIWSVLGLGWLVALRYFDWGAKSIPFFITLFGLCLLLPVSGDQTRVLAIVTFPLIAAYWLFNREFLEKISKGEISLIFIIWAIMPWGWVWEGKPKWSAFPYDVAYILHRLFGWFNVPPDPASWPF